MLNKSKGNNDYDNYPCFDKRQDIENELFEEHKKENWVGDEE